MQLQLPEDILHEFDKKGNSKTPITFIVPFRNLKRLTQLNKCVNNLLIRYPHCEIIIIEDNSSKTLNLKIPGVKIAYIFNKKLFNKSVCFNYGFLIAEHNVICGLDADMIIPSTLLDINLEHVYKDKVIFPGKDIYYLEKNINITSLNTETKWTGKTWLKDRALWQFHGGIFLTNKKTYAKVGGFDHRFEGYGSEDSNFYLRSTESGNAITSENTTLLHIDHEYDENESLSTETNKRIHILYSRINPTDRIKGCKENNIFNK